MHNPIIVQRLEAVAILVASVLAFHASGWSWWWFVALLFLVDYSLAGYLIGPKFGAALYNSMHSLIGPSALLGWWASTDRSPASPSAPSGWPTSGWTGPSGTASSTRTTSTTPTWGPSGAACAGQPALRPRKT
jgi:hypothetical protein